MATLMGLLHACGVAGKEVLSAFGKCSYTNTRLLRQSAEQKQVLSGILPREEDINTANTILGKIGHSLETLTGEEVSVLTSHNKLLHRDNAENWLKYLKKTVDLAYDRYDGPQDSLQFLRLHARELTKAAIGELQIKR